ncbi:MAG: creatininase family protein [Chloroflexi bacterium]|nr:MAG: creatininase family protein [Chloroflexota bacterium]
MYIDQPAARYRAEKRRVVLLPIGSCEQHGPFLPIDTDLRIALLLAEKVASWLAEDVVLLPALPFSCSHEHKGLGTYVGKENQKYAYSFTEGTIGDITCRIASKK